MSEAIQLDDYVDETNDSYTSRALARKSGGNGGAMDDVLKRLGALESSVSDLRIQVGGIAATMARKDELNKLQAQVSGIAATMATKDELNKLQAQVSGIAATMATKDDLNKLQIQASSTAATIPYLATKDALKELQAQVSGIAAAIPYLATKADLSAMETTIIKWIIATVLTSVGLAGGLAFSIARFVH